MTAIRDRPLLDRYLADMQAYVFGREAAAIERAYELGRDAVRAGIGLLEMSSLHKEALVTALRDQAGSAEGVRIAECAMDFFGECMGAFEMVHRGYQDANEGLRRSEAQLRLLTDSLPVLIAYVDRDLRYQFVNQTGETWHARPRGELVGRFLGDIVDEATFALVRPHAESALAGTVAAFEAATTYLDGKSRDIAMTFVPHRASDGAIEGFFALAQDDTERKATEAQLRQAQKMEAVGQLTGGVAHDFNNLLSVVVGNLDLLLEEASDNPRAVEFAEVSISAALRAADLTRKLLTFARRQQLDPKVIGLNEHVAGTVSLLRRTLGEHIEIEKVLEPELWPAIADPGQFESALVNLAINARDAMPGGGRLTIETGNRQLDDGYARENIEVKPGDYVMLGVSDTGTGMAPDVVARVFEPFFTTKPPGQGTGLGLSMVYGFVKQSQGHIKIYSEPGHGTAVRLYLPRAGTGAVPAVETTVAVLPSARTGERILVVEDNDDVRRIVVRQLRDLSYEILEAVRSEEALAHLDRGERIDLLFTDVVMPGNMTGDLLAREAQVRRPGLKVLLTSGFSVAAMQQGPRSSHIQNLLGKPYRMADLAAKLRSVLDAEA